MPTTSLHVSSRAPFVAAAFALVIGSAIVWFARDGGAMVPAAVPSAALSGPVPMPSVPVESTAAASAPAAATFAAAPAVATSAAPVTGVEDAPAEEDPFAAVIVEPVDPAEVLFGDRAKVAVSN